jgi:surface antigen
VAEPAFKRIPFLLTRKPPCLASREHLAGGRKSALAQAQEQGSTATASHAALAQAYRGGAASRLSNAVVSIPPLAAVAVVTLLTCGCSFSYNLGSLTGKDDALPAPPAAAPASVMSGRSGSFNSSGGPRISTGAMPTESDLAHARMAVAEAFSKGVSTQSTSWENPATGARGTITPISSPDQQEPGGVCRDFLASYVHGGDETWLEGAACRGLGGRWTVQRLTPWKRA